MPDRLLTVVDPRRFARLVREGVECNFATRGEAAAWLGSSRMQLHRWMTMTERRQIRSSRVNQLFGLIEGAKWRELRRAVIDPDANLIRQRYVDWLSVELRHFNLRVQPVIIQEPRIEEFWPPVSVAAYAHREAYRSALSWLRGDETCLRLLDEFEAKANRLGWKARDARYELALRRAVEPLTAHSRTGGVERSIGQLRQAKQLVTFLRASLRREMILLERDHDLLRAQGTAPLLDDLGRSLLRQKWPGTLRRSGRAKKRG